MEEQERPPVTLQEFEERARGLLPQVVYDYYAGGAGDEWTLAENRSAFSRWTFRPRVLAGVGERDTSTEVLGAKLGFPVLVAPMAFQRMAHPEGELATARAAERAGAGFVLSATAYGSIETLGQGDYGSKWFQLYVYPDREFAVDMVQRAEANGFGAIVFTVDTPVLGWRERDMRNDFDIPDEMPQITLDFAQDLTWDDLTWARGLSALPLLLKGVLTREDADRAVEGGVDVIVVSNHGGRQLDGSPAAIAALPEVVEAVAGRVPVLLDGGVRRGTDVLKALALGAQAVLVGRPNLWGLALDGEEGVLAVLQLIHAEFDNAMAIAGCRSVKDITQDLLAPA
jgi:isopentenyl diphosphate isomerase/L-lactate dehydrogenase-like FMN-dependent dehydrogenase